MLTRYVNPYYIFLGMVLKTNCILKKVDYVFVINNWHEFKSSLHKEKDECNLFMWSVSLSRPNRWCTAALCPSVVILFKEHVHRSEKFNYVYGDSFLHYTFWVKNFLNAYEEGRSSLKIQNGFHSRWSMAFVVCSKIFMVNLIFICVSPIEPPLSMAVQCEACAFIVYVQIPLFVVWSVCRHSLVTLSVIDAIQCSYRESFINYRLYMKCTSYFLLTRKRLWIRKVGMVHWLKNSYISFKVYSFYFKHFLVWMKYVESKSNCSVISFAAALCMHKMNMQASDLFMKDM